MDAIKLNPPSRIGIDGVEETFLPVWILDLDFTLNDNKRARIASVRMFPLPPKPLILWEGDEYDLMGDYTQLQVDERIQSLLGDDPASVLERLF